MKKQQTEDAIAQKNDDLSHRDCECGGNCGCNHADTHEESGLVTALQQAEEWKAKCMRALADYQNIERRSREEKNEVRLYANEVMLGRLLPVVDTFSKVQSHVNDMGFDLAFKDLVAMLEESGLTPIEVEGKEFNPHEMECIEVVEGKDNIVVEESVRGYRFYDKVLRVAQVKVGKKQAN